MICNILAIAIAAAMALGLVAVPIGCVVLAEAVGRRLNRMIGDFFGEPGA